MKYILVDTAGDSASVLVRNEDQSDSIELPNERRHSDVLLVKVDELLRKLSLKVADLEYMGVIIGPGSFTGIRIGIATIKGFEAVNPCKLVGLTVFDVLKGEIKDGVALLKCTKTSCYYAKYRNSAILETGVINNDELEKITSDEHIFVVKGDGVELETAEIVSDYPSLLKKAMEAAINNKEFLENNQLEAVYMQKPQAERGN